jgi:hypothetical protein
MCATNYYYYGLEMSVCNQFTNQPDCLRNSDQGCLWRNITICQAKCDQSGDPLSCSPPCEFLELVTTDCRSVMPTFPQSFKCVSQAALDDCGSSFLAPGCVPGYDSCIAAPYRLPDYSVPFDRVRACSTFCASDEGGAVDCVASSTCQQSYGQLMNHLLQLQHPDRCDNTCKGQFQPALVGPLALYGNASTCLIDDCLNMYVWEESCPNLVRRCKDIAEPYGPASCQTAIDCVFVCQICTLFVEPFKLCFLIGFLNA